jgi:hypothetical protein
VAQQGSPPRRPSRQPDPGQRGRADRSAGPDRPRRAERPDRASWQQVDAFGPESDAELPPWAAPSSFRDQPGGSRLRAPARRAGGLEDPYAEPAYADPYAGREPSGPGQDGQAGDEGGHDRPAPASAPSGPGRGRLAVRRRGRAAATRLRKSRRRVYRWSGIAIVVAVVAAGGVWLFGRSTPARTPWVTTLQAGEYKAVPNACTAVSGGVLDSYLPGPGRTQTVLQSGSTNSQCSYTIDKQPTFLVLQVSAEEYQPFAAAGRNGSATASAQDGFAAARQALARPPKKSPLPPAVISPLAQLGQQAFSASQHEHVTGISTDVITIVIRERNVLITVSLSGQESGHGFGPVPDATLAAGARAAAASVLAKVRAQPTA